MGLGTVLLGLALCAGGAVTAAGTPTAPGVAPAAPRPATEVPALQPTVDVEDELLEPLRSKRGAKSGSARASYSPVEKEAARLSSEWKGRVARPARGEDGSVVYTFGTTLPSVICAPLYVCDIALQPGEVVSDVHLGALGLWRTSRLTSGAGGRVQEHILVKPTDVGIRTNLLVTTDRRTYSIQLVADAQDWMPFVSFTYPDEDQARTNAQAQARQAELRRRSAGSTLPAGQNIDDLDFGYTLSNDYPRWRPVRVYTDRVKTYIEFPGEMKHDESPALVALSAAGQQQLVNYRVQGNRYVVDKVLSRAELISGVGGHQERVELHRNADGELAAAGDRR